MFETSLLDKSLPKTATFAFNNTQVGLVIYVLTQGRNPLEIFIFSFCFELAILMECFFKFGSIKFWSYTLITGAVLLNLSNHVYVETISLPVECFSYFLIAFSLKKIRNITNAKGKLKKNWRALGYILAPLFSPAFLAIQVLLIHITSILKENRSLDEKQIIIRLTWPRKYLNAYSSMMFHHIYYFSYAYLIIYIIMNSTKINSLFLGAVFYIGWVGYYLLAKTSKSPALSVIGGHMLGALAIMGMIFINETLPLLFFWLITGVGGGSIILLRNEVTEKDESAYDQFKIWESFGHLIGILGLGIALNYHWNSFAFFLGALGGFLCAICSSFFYFNNQSDVECR